MKTLFKILPTILLFIFLAFAYSAAPGGAMVGIVIGVFFFATKWLLSLINTKSK